MDVNLQMLLLLPRNSLLSVLLELVFNVLPSKIPTRSVLICSCSPTDAVPLSSLDWSYAYVHNVVTLYTTEWEGKNIMTQNSMPCNARS